MDFSCDENYLFYSIRDKPLIIMGDVGQNREKKEVSQPLPFVVMKVY